MRLLCICLFLMLAATASAASTYTPVLGVFLINDHLDMVQRGVTPSADNGSGLGLGLALDGGGGERVSVEYTDFDLGDSRRLRLLDLNLDHFFSVATWPVALHPFAGLAAGYGRLSFPSVVSEHVAYGVRLGCAWNLDPRFALELGGRYLHTGLVTYPGVGAEFAANADTSVWLGLEYRLQ